MNMILNTDSYKASHWLQYAPGTTRVDAYVESRGLAEDTGQSRLDAYNGIPKASLYFGLQMFIKEYLSKPITMADIQEAEEVWTAHGEPFNKAMWLKVLKENDGYLPISIRSVDEGLVMPLSTAMLVTKSEGDYFSMGSHLETSILRAIWYPTTVATVSWRIRQIIKSYLDKTAESSAGLNFMLHDFGSRGVSSYESAGIGGLAHLSTGFMGTDTATALMFGRKYYNENMAGFSIPAAEHSSIITWGKDREVEAYRNMLTQFAKKGSILAVVSDSYDIYNAVDKIWGETLRQEVIDSGATVVIRPDSGDPTSTVVKILRLLSNKFGYTVNSKGYKVLNNVKVIQGDGINEESISMILSATELNGFSAENLAFGMGGALLQHPNRDTLKFAMKASYTENEFGKMNVNKSPIGDAGKASKAGILYTVRNTKSGKIYTTTEKNHPALEDIMKDRYVNGEVMNTTTLTEVRARSNS